MSGKADIFIADASNRMDGMQKILSQFDLSIFSSAKVALKANYNSADPYPASTHIDTLQVLVRTLQLQKPEKLTLAERSGMGSTRTVLEDQGVIALSRQLGFSVIVLDELERIGWQEIQAPNLHWKRGFFIANLFTRSDRIVQTCCLKTHRFGGHFTLSLKNSVGCIARRVPGVIHDFMGELHMSHFQRSMIAEINKFYRNDLIVMDASEGFSTGGPDKGKIIKPGVIIAGNDRIAIDAVGVALLRSFGTIHDIMERSVFSQEQIARAVELEVGVGSTAEIKLVPLDAPSEKIADTVQTQFDAEK